MSAHLPTLFRLLLILPLLIGLSISCLGRPKAPNILFIAVDDLRPELNNYYADHIHSPQMDQLASESLVFDRAYCNVPVCGASRASLLSGVRPGWHRFFEYNAYLNKDHPKAISLPRLLRENGYETVSLGKIYHHQNDDLEAWDQVWRAKPKRSSNWCDYLSDESFGKAGNGPPYERANVSDYEYKDGQLTIKAIEMIKARENANQPFFLAVGFAKPHLPFNSPSKYWDLYDPSKIELPENYSNRPETTPKRAYHRFGELRHYSDIPKEGPLSDEMALKLIHGYYACVSYVDALIGEVLSALESTGLDKNTIVVLWSDHGFSLGDHQLWCKHSNFESALRVPLMLKVPGQASGQRTQNIVELVDLYPTITELTGLQNPDHLDGESLVPLLHGKTREKNWAIAKWHRNMTLIKGDLFYTEFLKADATRRTRMLFDFAKDPLELNNLAEAGEYRSTVDALHTFLRANWGEDFFTNYKNGQSK